MPSLGIGMMTPSALLTLLSLGFIMNMFQGVLIMMSLDEETAKKAEATRLNIDNLRTLSGDMQSKEQVMQAYQLGFAVLFSVHRISSMGTALAFSWVPEGRLDRPSNRAEDSNAVVEMVDLLDDEETDDGL
ncbi:hypothetical protein BDP55DRAFT_632351 [Colletotrichum godetiae]|uniref:Uncharacterized protein n=1 Tax=Colletotrichum godetiae TaxID=1209918 RepID=A0AAJ0AJR9_9PEZI|nr:uncharacterized protein BDP55DRAFT_632351 [Colletotrichum godetiae]KAK1675176.1 hypothetical protein BDP55DRAFT_632351 [Colletotrichum godetiae]